jgi:hypothetical protein
MAISGAEFFPLNVRRQPKYKAGPSAQIFTWGRKTNELARRSVRVEKKKN